MKKRNLAILMSLLAISLVFSQVSNQVTAVGEEFFYSDSIVPGESFTWKIKTFDFDGDAYEEPEDFHIGDTFISEGDTIKMQVIEDPDETNNTWYELYVNDVLTTDPENMTLGYLWVDYLILEYDEMVLVNPVTLTNFTDTYDIFQLIYDEYADETYDLTTSTVTTSGTLVVTRDETVNLGFTLTSKTFSTELVYYDYYHTVADDGTEIIDVLEAHIRTTVDRKTGVVREALSYLSFDLTEKENGTITYEDHAHSNFLMELKTGLLPYNWVYSVVGIVTIATFVFLKKKKN